MLPDFMVFLNWKTLPWFWYGFNHFWFAMLMMVLVPALLALVFGWLAFRSRVTGVYLSIITQALSYALMLAFFRNDMGFGGNNGFTDFKDILGFDLHSDSTRVVLLRRHRRWRSPPAISRAARSSRRAPAASCARSATRRAGRGFSAIRVESFKLWIFVFSAVIAGIAGALYVPQVGIINPSEFAPINSIEVVIWVAVGGRGTLYRRGRRRGARQLREDLFHRRASGSLALRARRVVRPGHAVSAARDHRPRSESEHRAMIEPLPPRAASGAILELS